MTRHHNRRPVSRKRRTMHRIRKRNDNIGKALYWQKKYRNMILSFDYYSRMYSPVFDRYVSAQIILTKWLRVYC